MSAPHEPSSGVSSAGSETLVDRLGPQAVQRLLDFLLEHDRPPPERRIFVNRTLRMETIGYVGFDLDWTLADYHRLDLEELVFQLTIDRLIEHHGYPEVVRTVTFRPDFPRRGLLIDREAGTVLGMSRHRYVNRAYLGRERLDRGELKRLYRYQPIRPTGDRFYHLDSLFELPEANLYGELIELSRREEKITSSSQRLFDDLRAAIDWVHAEGPLKSQVLAQPARYLDRSEELALALLRLALHGRRLFLLTNSQWPYVDGLCSHLFDGILPGLDRWRQLFDLVIVDAAKPSFFRERRPFVVLDEGGAEDGTCPVPSWGGIYREGNLEGLMQLIAAPGDTVLYIGDHIYGDVVSSKLESTWRTALIVHELEDEIRTHQHLRDVLEEQAELADRLIDLGGQMDHLRDVVALRSRLGESSAGAAAATEQARAEFLRAQGEHRHLLRRTSRRAEEIANRFSPHWGSFFKQGASKTRFASQIETYACLYTSRVANFSFYGTDHYFRVARDPMMHELTDG